MLSHYVSVKLDNFLTAIIFAFYRYVLLIQTPRLWEEGGGAGMVEILTILGPTWFNFCGF